MLISMTDFFALCGGDSREVGQSEVEVVKAMAVYMGVPAGAIIPVVVNYTYGLLFCGWATFIPLVSALEKSTAAMHEWVGIIWYSLR